MIAEKPQFFLVSLLTLFLSFSSPLLAQADFPPEDASFEEIARQFQNRWNTIDDSSARVWLKTLEAKAENSEQKAQIPLHRARIHLVHGRLDEAQINGELGLEKAEEVSVSQLVGRYEVLLGEVARDAGKPEEALEHANRAIQSIKEQPSADEFVWAWFLKSTLLIRNGETEAAETALDSLLFFAESSQDSGNIGTAYQLKSEFYTTQGNFGKALEMSTLAEPFVFANGDRFQLGQHWFTLGMLHNAFHHTELAENYCLKALEIGKALELDILVGMVNNELAVVNLRKGDTTNAISNYLEALIIFRGLGFAGQQAAVCNNLSWIYLKQDNTHASKKYAYEGLALAVRSQNGEMVSFNALHLAESFNREALFDSSVFYLDLAYENVQSQKLEVRIHEEYSIAFEGLNQPQIALEHQRKVSEVQAEMEALKARKYADSLEIALKLKEEPEVPEKVMSHAASGVWWGLGLGLLVISLVGFWVMRKGKDGAVAVLKDEEAMDVDAAKKSSGVNIEQLRESLQTRDWAQITIHFEHAWPGMLGRLLKDFPNLSPTDQRVVLLSKLGLSTSEMAEIMGISVDGAKKARQRCRKKLGLQRTESLQAFLGKFA